MSAVNIGDANFRETYQNNEIVVLDFWGQHCGPCHQFAPIYDKVAEQYSDIVFGKVNTQDEQKLSVYFQVRSIPTIIVLKEEIEVFRHTGMMGEDELKKLVDQIKSTPMSVIKEKLGIED